MSRTFLKVSPSHRDALEEARRGAKSSLAGSLGGVDRGKPHPKPRVYLIISV